MSASEQRRRRRELPPAPAPPPGAPQLVKFLELEKPREAPRVLELMAHYSYDDVVGALAEHLGLPQQNKDGNYIRLTARSAPGTLRPPRLWAPAGVRRRGGGSGGGGGGGRRCTIRIQTARSRRR